MAMVEILTRIRRISQHNVSFFGSGIRRIISTASQFSAVWACLKTPFSSSEDNVHGVLTCTSPATLQVVDLPDPDPPKLLYEVDDWLMLQAAGLEEVRVKLSSTSSRSEGSEEHRLFSLLHTMNLVGLLTEVWQWQDVQICQSFVRQWDRTTQRTRVFDVPVDVSYQNFMAVTGLMESATRGHMKSGPPTFLSLHKDSVLCSLYLMLNHTVLFTNTRSNYPTTDVANLLLQLVKGEKEEWTKSIYGKFIEELERLHDEHELYPLKKLETLAGPIMCFLYSEARHKYELRRNRRRSRQSWRTKKMSLSSFYEVGGSVTVEEGGSKLNDDQKCPLQEFKPTTLPKPRVSESSVLSPESPFQPTTKPGKLLCQVPKLKLRFRPSSIATSSKRACQVCQMSTELPLSPSTTPKTQSYKFLRPQFEFETADFDLGPRKPSQFKSDKTQLEKKVSQLVVAAGFGVSEAEQDLLNQAFEEQKRRQELFKAHLRSNWL